MIKRLGGFFANITLMRWLRLAACAGLVWLRVYPADWSPCAVYAFYALRGFCWACLAVSLTRYAVVLRLANRQWWRVLVKLPR